MISGMTISNFRGIADTVEVEFEEDLTALVGHNGSGKTTVIDAIRAFFERGTTIDDFNNKDKPVKISIRFSDLRPQLRTLAKCKNDDECEITFITDLENGSLTHRFEPAMSGTEWADFLDQSVIVIGSMDELGSEMIDLTGSPLIKLLRYDRSKTGTSKAAYDRYRNYMDTLPSLDDLSEGVSNKLKDMGSSLQIKFIRSNDEPNDMHNYEIYIKMKADGDFVEFSSNAGGHQRLASYALLLYLHDSNNSASGNKPVLVIDEPELHQHPIRQDTFYSVLRKLAENLQIIYATHSDKFISMKDLPCLRFFEKSGDEVIISSTDFDRLASLADKIIKDPTPERMEKDLSVVDTPDFRSSLFSRKAVLVEGVSDRAVIKSVASKIERDLTELGISVVPCGGKDSIRAQLLVYRDLKIPYYVIWDLDLKKSKKNPKCTCHTNNDNEEEANDKRNRRIFGYMGVEPPDSIKEVVTKSYSCIHGSMNDLVNSIDEDMVKKHKKEISDSLNVKPFNEKNDYMMEKLIDKIYETHALERIEEIVKKITDE